MNQLPESEILTSAILKVCAVLLLKGLVTSMAEKQDQVSSKKVFYTQCLNFYQVYTVPVHFCNFFNTLFISIFYPLI